MTTQVAFVEPQNKKIGLSKRFWLLLGRSKFVSRRKKKSSLADFFTFVYGLDMGWQLRYPMATGETRERRLFASSWANRIGGL